ncbi:MAG TPA: MFS transporter [Candidatus Binatia bacterium]|jgi:MFS family permease|nr:MFS transporter [Candidatus Binatia bacterium]
MRGAATSRDARLMLSGIALDAFGTGLTVPFLVVYLHDVRALPLETIGIIVAVPALIALVLLGPIGMLIDRLGPRRVQMGALAGAAAGVFLLSSAESVFDAVVARILTGIGVAAFWPANQALVASIVSSERRQRYFGVQFACVNAGIGIGGIIGALFVDTARPGTFVAIYRADAATFLLALAILAVPLRHLGGPPARSRTIVPDDVGSYADVLRDRVFRRYLVVSFVAAFVGYGQIEGGWTAYANAVARVSSRTLGIAFAVNTAIIVLLQLVVLRLIDGRRRTRLLMIHATVWGASWAVLGLAGQTPASPLADVLMVVAFGLFGVGETLLSPTAPAIVNDVAPERLRGRYNATAAVAFQGAAISGPVVAGILLGRNLGDAFIAMLIAGCAVLGVAALRLERVLPSRANGVHDTTAAANTR